MNRNKGRKIKVIQIKIRRRIPSDKRIIKNLERR